VRNASIESVRKGAVALIAGGALTAISGVASQLVQLSTSVSDKLWSYPWSSGAFVPVSLLYLALHVLVFVGLLGWRRSGMAGPGRAAAVGTTLVLVGTALLFIGELASIPIRAKHVADTVPSIVGGVFGMGTLLSAVGLLVAGKATFEARLWHGWRRLTPLIAGAWTLVLVVLAPTHALATGVGIYGVCLLAIGIALHTRPSPATPQPAPTQGRAAPTTQNL